MNINEVIFQYIDLLSEKYGGQALFCSDDFFAGKDNLVKQTDPIFIEDKYTERGKWMDGWESQRRRDDQHDWCVLRLGVRGRIKVINAQTTHFKGNAPSSVSVDVCRCTSDKKLHQAEWFPLIESTLVQADSDNLLVVENNEEPWTHIRLNIFPDGGVARLRAYGEPYFDWQKVLPGELIDLAGSTTGGRALACSDMFFSSMHNLIAPGRGVNMGDGWETKRRRGPGHDWVVIALAAPGQIRKVEVDTHHFRGNFPDRFALFGCYDDSEEFDPDRADWQPLISEQGLFAHRQHIYLDEIQTLSRPVSHVRLEIYPDGGVSRLRVFGYPKLD